METYVFRDTFKILIDYSTEIGVELSKSEKESAFWQLVELIEHEGIDSAKDFIRIYAERLQMRKSRLLGAHK